MESQLAAKRRQRAAAPRAEAPAGAQHFVPPWHGQAAPAPQWMHGGGGGMPHAFGADPVAAAARSTALAAVASGFQHAGGDRNAALGLAAASLLWTDVAHMQAATVAARAMAAGAAGQDGAGANPFAAGGGRHHHAPPAHVAQQMLSVLTAFGVPHGGDPFASYAHAPPQQLHVHPPRHRRRSSHRPYRRRSCRRCTLRCSSSSSSSPRRCRLRWMRRCLLRSCSRCLRTT